MSEREFTLARSRAMLAEINAVRQRVAEVQPATDYEVMALLVKDAAMIMAYRWYRAQGQAPAEAIDAALAKCAWALGRATAQKLEAQS